jgi:hypothetical protein
MASEIDIPDDMSQRIISLMKLEGGHMGYADDVLAGDFMP